MRAGSSDENGSAWPRGRSIDGGIDEIPLPAGVDGRLWLCGKHVIGPDPDGVVARVDATSVVCLTQRHELSDRFPDYVAWLDREVGSRAVWHPIHDLSVPAHGAFADLVADVATRLRAGERVIVHCAAGIGRAGTLAVGVMIHLGMERSDALQHVAAHRPMAGPEVGAQAALIEAFAARPR